MYAPFAGPLYTGGTAGGAELQAVTIARLLAAAGLRVRHVVADAGGLQTTPEGVELVELSHDYRRRGLPRRRAIIQALREADGRVYIQRSAGIETGFVGMYTRTTGRRSVFSASSDADFTRDRSLLAQVGGSLEQWPVRMQYRVGLHTVHAVVAQTEQQAAIARSTFDLEPQVIPSVCAPVERRESPREAALWIGSLTDVKNPLAYLELAERAPEVPFWMVAHDHWSGWKELAADVRARARTIANLELLAPRPRDQLFDLYDRALAVVNTSRFEGFPNTFLEGWARGVPAVSLRVDPDGVIARHGLGVAAGGSLEVAAEAIRRYAADPAANRAAGEAARAHVARTHAPDIVSPRWVALVSELAGSC